MNRRKFLFTNVSLLSILPFANLFGFDTEIKKLSKSCTKHDCKEVDAFLTNNFFKYLNSNSIPFPYERVYAPSFNINGSDTVVKTRKLIEAFNEDLIENVSMLNDSFPNIVKELSAEYDYRKQNGFKNPKFYILELLHTAVIYNPKSFIPRRGFMIRYRILEL